MRAGQSLKFAIFIFAATTGAPEAVQRIIAAKEIESEDP
jgi:hypothetical protein